MKQKKPFDPISYIRRYLPIIALVSLFAFLIIYIYIITGKQFSPRYSAEALLNINPYFSRILYKTEETEWIRSYEDWMRTQVNVLKSYPVLEKAIENHEAEGFLWRHSDETIQSAVNRLAARLDIKQIRETQIISISMVANTKEGLAEIINSVIKSYIDNERNLRIKENNFKLEQLTSEKEKIKKELEVSYQKLEEVSEKFGTAISDEKNLYVYIESLNDLRSSYNEILVKRINMQKKHEALNNMQEEIKNLDVSALANENMDKNEVLLDNLIHYNRKEQEIIEEMVGLKAEHPRYIFLQKKLRELQAQSKNISNSLTEKQKNIIKDKMITDNEIESKEILNEYETLNSTEKQLKIELDKLQNDILDYNTAVLRASTRRQEITRLQGTLNRINERIDQILIESTSPGRMTIQSEALVPENPSVEKRPKLLALGFLGSLFIGVALALALGFLDNRINNTNDFEKVLGFPITGHVIDANYDNIKSSDVYSVYNKHPDSFLYQQYTQISLQLQKEHREHGSKVFTFSSLKDGNGSSSLALNSLAAVNASKDRKLYIDLNTRNPLSTRYPEFKNISKINEFIENMGNKDQIFDSMSKFPFRALTASDGKYDSIIQQLSNIEQLLNYIKNDYDYIFIDAPPLLMSSASLELASLSDVVILTPKFSSTNWNDLIRGIGILDHLGIKVISVVLNKVTYSKPDAIKKEIGEYYGSTDILQPSALSLSGLYDLNNNLGQYANSLLKYILGFSYISKSLVKKFKWTK
jgi:uncharacterized protein involved in exopolysaccharide biosynthesis/Mrp family chromosome partitioning ATPase